ncbi:hypothetical protein B0H14DRAFT_2927543 [Mycena olivaceomarginata]|nr:hypothetical protein B0H14DRAFT_2927543 [Mycena olivaceomarginata]
MRGAERPGEVKWHPPFLPPLEPLSDSASRQIFLGVAYDPGAGEESALRHLLDLSGSLPLAVSLMASIASFERMSEFRNFRCKAMQGLIMPEELPVWLESVISWCGAGIWPKRRKCGWVPVHFLWGRRE